MDDNTQASDQSSSQWNNDVGGLGTPPAIPTDDTTADDTKVNPMMEPVDAAAPQAPALHESASLPDATSTTNDLLDIKTKALGQLSPIVSHLDQSPEEKFKTTMMMIQASDNQELIKDAYEAAQQITDEKVKAQALLDVVNEINYFTRQASN